MNEQENTFRILSEEPLLVTSFWCRFGLHNWTKYREPERTRQYTGPDLLLQIRCCGSCNIQNRTVVHKF